MSVSINVEELQSLIEDSVKRKLSKSYRDITRRYGDIDTIKTAILTSDNSSEVLIEQTENLEKLRDRLIEAQNTVSSVESAVGDTVEGFETTLSKIDDIVKIIKNIDRLVVIIASSIPLQAFLPGTGIATTVSQASESTLTLTTNTLEQVLPKLRNLKRIILSFIGSILTTINDILRIINALLALLRSLDDIELNDEGLITNAQQSIKSANEICKN